MASHVARQARARRGLMGSGVACMTVRQGQNTMRVRSDLKERKLGDAVF
jgi:hypothetical protein